MYDMKRLIFSLAAISLLTVSCSVIEDRASCLAPVSVHISDFSVTQSDLPTKATQDPADYTNVGAITLAFYDGANEVFKTTRIKSETDTYTTFGDFSCNLPIGNYTLVALAYMYREGDVFVLTSPTEAAFTSERPRETFCATQAVTVSSTSPLELSVTLNRISSRLRIVSTDGRPSGVTKIRTSYAKGGKGFNPTTGLATTDTGFSQINNPSSAVGAPIDITSCPFLATDEETINITIEALDAEDHVLITKVVPNVPLRRNRETTLTGAVFTAGASSASFRLETGWLDPQTVNF